MSTEDSDHECTRADIVSRRALKATMAIVFAVVAVAAMHYGYAFVVGVMCIFIFLTFA